ncbi:MAG: hypothetical protein MZW92_27910 [Comamonadaceae bacterium]|nr:hypothetical protein [Comamonadaceae bacterium]
MTTCVWPDFPGGLVGGVRPAVASPCSTEPTGWLAAPLGLPTAVRGGYGAAELLGLPGMHAAPAPSAIAGVRRLEVATVGAAALPAGNLQHHVQVSFCPADPVAQPLVFGRDPAAFTLRNRAYQPQPLRSYVSRIYFVASWRRCGVGDDTPTLKPRLDLRNGDSIETALVEGVEELRFEYGLRHQRRWRCRLAGASPPARPARRRSGRTWWPLATPARVLPTAPWAARSAAC